MKRHTQILTTIAAALALGGCVCSRNFEPKTPNDEKASKGVPISAWTTIDQGPPGETPTYEPGAHVEVTVHMKQGLTNQLTQHLITRIDEVRYTPPEEADIESGKDVGWKNILADMDGCKEHPCVAKKVDISFDILPREKLEAGTYLVFFTCVNEDHFAGTPDGQGFRWGRFIVKVEE